MKPPPFRYHDPTTISEVIGILSSQEEVKLLAGGQSLMPMMSMRYVMPSHVVDLNRVEELSYIREDGDHLRMGAMTRQRDIEFSELVSGRSPLLHEAILHVGHRQTRNRGTLGGSLAHLDPSAELPLVATAFGATVRVQGARGLREIPMEKFPAAYMTPAIESDEVLTDVSFPLWPSGHGHAFTEYARRPGDFAIAAAAVMVTIDARNRIACASVCIGGVGKAPMRCNAAETLVVGEEAGERLFADAAETCRSLDAMEDVFAPSWYRQHLAVVLVRRALSAACTRAHRASVIGEQK